MSDPDATLDEMALALSAALQPDLDVIGAMAQLDELAAECGTPTRDGIVEHLFTSGRLVGDRDDYHRWQNSCIDHVVRSGHGMPITLTVVAIEIARRLGVELAGIGMPGHFLLGDPHDRGWFADPFHGLGGLDADDCRRLLLGMGVTQWSPRFLEPTPPRLIVARMLNNLKIGCERRGDRVRLAIVIHARAAVRELATEGGDASALAVLN